MSKRKKKRRAAIAYNEAGKCFELARKNGMEFRRYSDYFYQLRTKTNIYNIYPTTRKVMYADNLSNLVCPLNIDFSDSWSMLAIIKELIE